MSIQQSSEDRSAVEKAISVLRAFEKDAHLPIGVSELARRTDLSKSTTFRLLGMLERNGVVERAGTSYRLGHVIKELGAQAVTPNHDRIRDAVTPFLADLYEATHMTVQLAVLSGTHVVYLNKLEGHDRLRTPSRIGGRMPAYSTAVGKVLLAYDAASAEEVLKTTRQAWTANTIVTDDGLRDELRRVRHSAVALDRGESLAELACLATPVMGARDVAIAAISISGDIATFPAGRLEAIVRRVGIGASRAAGALRSAA
jgi:IclR family KDG regulon transcriptional repressor